MIEAAKFENPALAALLIAGDMLTTPISTAMAGFARYFALCQPMVTIAASGNHDVIRNYGGRSLLLPGPGNAVDVWAFAITRNWAAAVAVIDTETPAAFSAQAEWLKTVMGVRKKFKLVLMHRALTPPVRRTAYPRFWPAVFDEAGIDLVLSVTIISITAPRCSPASA